MKEYMEEQWEDFEKLKIIFSTRSIRMGHRKCRGTRQGAGKDAYHALG